MKKPVKITSGRVEMGSSEAKENQVPTMKATTNMPRATYVRPGVPSSIRPGVQIGSLTAVREYGNKYRSIVWLWECPCGRQYPALPGLLRARQQRNPGEKIR